MPPIRACTSSTALEVVASATIVWSAKGRRTRSTVVIGESCAGGWAGRIESDGLVRDGLLLELGLELVW